MTVTVPSAFRRPSGQPRFTLSLPDWAEQDIGGRVLIGNERDMGGYEYATRKFLDEHVEADDLFLDVGAHWGIMSLQAASRHPRKTQVIALECMPDNAQLMAQQVRRNDLERQIEVINSGAGASSGVARIVRNTSTMGHFIEPVNFAGPGTIPIVSLDQLLMLRPQHKARRLVVKVDVEGAEPEVVAGMAKLLDAGRVKALILERGQAFDRPEPGRKFLATLDGLKARGFTLWRFADEGMAGPLIPYVFNGELLNIFALAPGETPRPVYDRPFGPFPPTHQPDRVRLAPPERAAWTHMLMEAKGTDGGWWVLNEAIVPGAEERAQAARPHLPDVGTVLDLGCGAQALRPLLAEGVKYLPADLVKRSADCLAGDLNAGWLPDGPFDTAVVLAVLEYLHDPAGVLKGLRERAKRLVVSYDATPEGRRERGFVNELDLPAALETAGWAVESRDGDLWVCR